MQQGFFKTSWRSLLPEVFTWIDQVQTSVAKDSPKGALHIVPVRGTGDSTPPKIEVLATALGDETKRKLVDYATAIGWQAGSGGQHLNLMLDGTPFVLLSVVKQGNVPAIQKARQLGLDTAKAIKSLTVDHVVLCRSTEFSSLAVFDGFVMGLYDLSSFKGTTKATGSSKLPKKVTFLGDGDDASNPALVKECKELAKAVTLTRTLQDAPANWLDPVRFGDIAADLAKEVGVKCTVKTKSEISALGMGSFVGVSNGSAIEPRLITLEIDGQDNTKTTCLVGKGLTFDSGGISIKPSLGMGEMKYDMSGGAAVLGSAYFFSKVKPPVKVVCVIGATENMPSGSATKPGDIHVAMNGKTIEVLNTDAEGRLVLADLLHYAVTQFNPAMMIDIATLTGAVLQALGHSGAGIMSNDQDTADFILAAAKRSGEPLWQLPLWPELEKEVKGEVADLQNIAKPNVAAGTIMGGMFLKEFVADKKWAHIDIAGTAWSCKAIGYPANMGTAFGLRTMVESCRKFNT